MRPVVARSRRRVGPAFLLALLASLVLSACGSEEPEPFRVPAAQQAACASLLAALPETVAGQRRTDTTNNDGVARWGDPAIELRCGVGKPRGFLSYSICQRTEGIDWFVPDAVMEDQSADVLMTTVGRRPNVSVTVPASYRPSLAPMTDLAPALRAETRSIDPCN